MQKLVTETSWLKLSNLTFHLSCNMITFSEVYQSFLGVEQVQSTDNLLDDVVLDPPLIYYYLQ
jgi:hypothetical protein